MGVTTSVFKRAYGFTAHQLTNMLGISYYKVYKAHTEGRLAKMVDELFVQVRRDRMDVDAVDEREEEDAL